MLDLAKADADGGSPKNLRDLAIVRMLHDLGLRRGELESIDLADLDLDGPTVAVIGKGRTEPVPLTGSTRSSPSSAAAPA